jgi:hypothetical protein
MHVLAKEVESTYISKGEEAAVPTTSPAPLISATPPPQLSVDTPAQSDAAPLPPTVTTTTETAKPLVPAINPAQSPAVNMERVAQVRAGKTEAEIEKFEEEFSDLKSDTREFLSDKESQNPKFLARFRDHLLDLPVSKRAIHARFFYKNENEIFKAENIERIFAILRPYCNYSNYDIILHLVKKFCDDPLKKRMLDYRDSFDSFEEVITVDIYLCAISVHPKSDVYQAFSKMIMTIDKPACECTLRAIRQLRESLAESADIHSYSAYVECMTTNSVLVVLRIPPSCVVWVGVAMTPDFMQAHHLTDVSIDGKDITFYQSREYLGQELCGASERGDVVGVVSLIALGADVNTVDKDGWSALMLAAGEGKTEVVVELVKAGANVDMQTKDGASALMAAAQEGKTEAVVELVKAGANVDMQTKDGASALMAAAQEGKTEAVVEWMVCTDVGCQ